MSPLLFRGRGRPLMRDEARDVLDFDVSQLPLRLYEPGHLALSVYRFGILGVAVDERDCPGEPYATQIGSLGASVAGDAMTLTAGSVERPRRLIAVGTAALQFFD